MLMMTTTKMVSAIVKMLILKIALSNTTMITTALEIMQILMMIMMVFLTKMMLFQKMHLSGKIPIMTD